MTPLPTPEKNRFRSAVECHYLVGLALLLIELGMRPYGSGPERDAAARSKAALYLDSIGLNRIHQIVDDFADTAFMEFTNVPV